jgi:hypothetical protein
MKSAEYTKVGVPTASAISDTATSPACSTPFR